MSILHDLIVSKLVGSSGGGGGGSGTDSNAVHYTADSGKTAAQKAQARTNIGAASYFPVSIAFSSGWTADKTVSECLAAIAAGQIVLFALVNSGVTYEAIALRAEGGLTGLFAITLSGGRLYIAEIWYRTENGVDTVDVTGYTVAREPTIVTDLTSTSITLSASANTEYRYGELTSLTVSSSPDFGAYMIVFTSGATPTVTTFPATILGLEDFAAEANTRYEINVLDGRAVYMGWPLPASE